MEHKPEWLPYFGPMVAFALALALPDYLDGPALLFLVLRVSAPLALFLFFFSKASYPELKRFQSGMGGIASDLAFGIFVAAVWVAPYLIWPNLRPGAMEAFDAHAQGLALGPLFLVLRFAGFVAVTPLIEELLVRSYLIRAADIYPNDRSFREIPIGTFAKRSFWFTVAWFTFTHATWEWPVAFLAGVLYNLWLYRRKHIGSLVVSHAATNMTLFVFVTAVSPRTGMAGDFWDLWFFL